MASMSPPSILQRLCALSCVVVLIISVYQKTSQLSESKWCVPIFEWRRFIVFGRIKVILTIYRLI